MISPRLKKTKDKQNIHNPMREGETPHSFIIAIYTEPAKEPVKEPAMFINNDTEIYL